MRTQEEISRKNQSLRVSFHFIVFIKQAIVFWLFCICKNFHFHICSSLTWLPLDNYTFSLSDVVCLFVCVITRTTGISFHFPIRSPWSCEPAQWWTSPPCTFDWTRRLARISNPGSSCNNHSKCRQRHEDLKNIFKMNILPKEG